MEQLRLDIITNGMDMDYEDPQPKIFISKYLQKIKRKELLLLIYIVQTSVCVCTSYVHMMWVFEGVQWIQVTLDGSAQVQVRLTFTICQYKPLFTNESRHLFHRHGAVDRSQDR